MTTGNVSLGNSFIPSITPLMITRSLSRLSVQSLTNLCILWSQLPQTQPKPSKLQQDELEITQDWLVQDFQTFLKKFKSAKLKSKRTLIDKILVDYYRSGLNLLQYAQLDSQLMIDKPLNFYWQASKILNSTHDEEEIINLRDPQSFLNHLLAELSKFYLNHIYISNHPHYPLLIIRIQLFDLISDGYAAEVQRFTTSSSILSRKPIFIALPINSSNIIHSYQTPSNPDPAVKIVIQCFETAISNTLDKQLRIQIDENEPPIRSLESLHILKGNSRFAESLGPWAPYADGTVDISPFDDASQHSTFTQKKIEHVEPDERKRRIAMLRFKGRLEGLKSEKLFEDNVNRRKRKLKEEGTADDEDDEPAQEVNEYQSITPVQFAEFEVRNEYKDLKPKVKLRFNGRDIFGGLHELCDQGIMDPETLPGWLTGQESQSYNGIIEDDVFIPRSKIFNDSTLI